MGYGDCYCTDTTGTVDAYGMGILNNCESPMKPYLIIDMTTGRSVGVVYAKTVKGAKAYWTRHGTTYVRFMYCHEI